MPGRQLLLRSFRSSEEDETGSEEDVKEDVGRFVAASGNSAFRLFSLKVLIFVSVGEFGDSQGHCRTRGGRKNDGDYSWTPWLVDSSDI